MRIRVFLQNFRALTQLDSEKSRGQTDRQTNRQTNKQTDRQTHRENSKTEQPYFLFLGKSFDFGKLWSWAND